MSQVMLKPLDWPRIYDRIDLSIWLRPTHEVSSPVDEKIKVSVISSDLSQRKMSQPLDWPSIYDRIDLSLWLRPNNEVSMPLYQLVDDWPSIYSESTCWLQSTAQRVPANEAIEANRQLKSGNNFFIDILFL